MAFGSTPKDNQNTPLGSVYTPGTANSDLTVLEGGPISTDANTQKSAPVSMYAKGGSLIDFGAQADTAATSDTGTFSFVALVKRLLTKLPAIGQQAKAASLSVTLASDDTSLGAPGDASATSDSGTFSLIALMKRLLAKFGAGVTLGNVALLPQVSGGTTAFHLVTAATNNATSLKGTAGQLYGYEISNTNAAVRYVKFYNKATAPAPASDNALLLWVVGVPGSGRASFHSSIGIAFSTGIGIAAVTGSSDTDNTSVAVGDLIINIERS